MNIVDKVSEKVDKLNGDEVSRVGANREGLMMRKVILNDGKLREAEI